MKFHDCTFFVNEAPLNDGPKLSLNHTEDKKDPWPITLHIGEDYRYVGKGITIYLNNEPQLIQFVNSVKSSYNKYRKDKGYDR